MPRFVYITDVHVRSTTPVRRKDDFLCAVRDKLNEVVDYCNAEGVDALLIGGDLYDSYSPSPSSILCVMETLGRLKCPAYSILGNHEMLGHQKESFRDRMIGVLHRFRNDYPVQLLEGHWNSPSLTVKDVPVWAMHYEHGIEERLKSLEFADVKPGILMAHANIVKSPAVFPDHVLYTDVKSPASVILCSHYHKKQGVERIGPYMFVSCGALSRGTVSMDDLTRTPAFAVIEVDGLHGATAQIVDLKCAKPAEEVFDLESVREEMERDNRLSEFIDQIRMSGVLSDIESISSLVMAAEGVEERVKNKALEVLSKV